MNLEMGPEDVQFQKEFALFSDQILEPIASQIDNSGVFQSRFFDIAKERKLLTPFLPIELGGQGKGLQTLTILLEELGRNSPVASLLVAQQVIFGIRTILSDSNLPEREELAKKAANFDLILTLAATEFEAGCDLSAITTVCRQKTESCFSISGKKAYVNWASRSGFLFTFTETESTDSASGTSLFAIPNPSKGLSVGTPYKTMGFSGLETSPVDFDDCRVEAFQVIGVHGFGDHIFEKITNELRIAMAAIATGLGQQAFSDAASYAKTRKQFGKPVGSFQNLQWRFADAAAMVEASRLHVWRAVERSNDKSSFLYQAAIAKWFAADAAYSVADFAVQVLGGKGYISGNRVERLFRDSRFLKICSGTSEILSNLVSSKLG